MRRSPGGNFLDWLRAGIRKGVASLNKDRKEAHSSTVRKFQNSDGGFSGRQGSSDLYYTAFAVEALSALGALTEEELHKAWHFALKTPLESIVDAVNTLRIVSLRGGKCHELIDFVESFRTSDGGYGKRREDSSGSTYHTFLACLFYDYHGIEPPEAEGLTEFLRARQREDGGFVENDRAEYSSANATSAGLSLGSLLRLSSEEFLTNACRYLSSHQTDAGGWSGGVKLLIPDLLSSFSAVVALHSVFSLTKEQKRRVLDFVLRLEQPAGGFSGTPLDNESDVEYTYYGLGVLALCGDYG